MPEFVSMVPARKCLYVFYVAFGEIIAWIIGWALIMEYSAGNITVAISGVIILQFTLW
jgi:hypothetical protein